MNNLEWWWKFSYFCRNSGFLKGLAHEISDEIRKKLKCPIVMVLKIEVIIIVSQDKHHYKFGVVVEIFNFLSKFSIFKSVSPQKKLRNPKKNKIFDFNGMKKRSNNDCLP